MQFKISLFIQMPGPPLPLFQIPDPWEKAAVKCPGLSGGGRLKFRIDRYIRTKLTQLSILPG